MPGAIIATAKVRAPARAAARVRRLAGRTGTVELFIAFDDPNSAVALIELDRRLAGRSVALAVRPVLDRDMEGDPAIEAKRAYAIVDANRIAARSGWALARSEPIDPAETAFLADWVSAAGSGVAVKDFAVAAMKAIWADPGNGVDREALAGTWERLVGGPPPAGGSSATRANEKLMKRRGAYSVPMAWVHGRLFFAHDRLDSIESELDRLGWRQT